jgi:hypothetical protein
MRYHIATIYKPLFYRIMCGIMIPLTAKKIPSPLMPFVAKEDPQVTPAKVAAICESLGPDHATLRAVHERIGGSMRDVARLVKDWRLTHPKSTLLIPDTTELAAQISARLVAADVGQSSVRLVRWRQSQEKESKQWRDEIGSLRTAIEDLRQHVAMAAGRPADDANVVSLRDRAAPPELNTALTRLNARLDQLEHDLAERDAKLPATLEATLTSVSRNAEASAEKIAQVLADLPQTLRQAPVSHVDQAINQRLETTVFELTHRAAEIAARPDRTDDMISAIERTNASAARRQARQARQSATTQDALLARLDALVTAATKSRRAKARKKAKPARRARTTRKVVATKRKKKPARAASRPGGASFRRTHTPRTPTKMKARKLPPARKPTVKTKRRKSK